MKKHQKRLSSDVLADSVSDVMYLQGDLSKVCRQYLFQFKISSTATETFRYGVAPKF